MLLLTCGLNGTDVRLNVPLCGSLVEARTVVVSWRGAIVKVTARGIAAVIGGLKSATGTGCVRPALVVLKLFSRPCYICIDAFTAHLCSVERIEHSCGIGLRNLDKCAAIHYVDSADCAARHSRFVGDGANDVARANAVLPSDLQEE